MRYAEEQLGHVAVGQYVHTFARGDHADTSVVCKLRRSTETRWSLQSRYFTGDRVPEELVSPHEFRYAALDARVSRLTEYLEAKTDNLSLRVSEVRNVVRRLEALHDDTLNADGSMKLPIYVSATEPPLPMLGWCGVCGRKFTVYTDKSVVCPFCGASAPVYGDA